MPADGSAPSTDRGGAHCGTGGTDVITHLLAPVQCALTEADLHGSSVPIAVAHGPRRGAIRTFRKGVGGRTVTTWSPPRGGTPIPGRSTTAAGGTARSGPAGSSTLRSRRPHRPHLPDRPHHQPPPRSTPTRRSPRSSSGRPPTGPSPRPCTVGCSPTSRVATPRAGRPPRWRSCPHPRGPPRHRLRRPVPVARPAPPAPPAARPAPPAPAPVAPPLPPPPTVTRPAPPQWPGATGRPARPPRTAKLTTDLAIHGLAYAGVALVLTGVLGFVVFAFGDVGEAWRPLAEIATAAVLLGTGSFLRRRGAPFVGDVLVLLGGMVVPILLVAAFVDGAPVPPDLTGGAPRARPHPADARRRPGSSPWPPGAARTRRCGSWSPRCCGGPPRPPAWPSPTPAWPGATSPIRSRGSGPSSPWR